MTQPYEPPPDYPMLEEPWPIRSSCRSSHDARREHRLPPSPQGAVFFDPRYYNEHRRLRRCPEAYRQPPSPLMLRTRQYPEVAGIFGCEEQPALRRFTRYNEPPPQPLHHHHLHHMPSSAATEFSKSSKKPSFFTGNWTFREKKQPSRPPLQRLPVDPFRRDERPLSMHCDVRVARSRSETASRPPAPLVTRREASPQPQTQPQPPPRVLKEKKSDFTTRITVEDGPIMRNKEGKEERRSIQSSLRKSCPELETAGKIMDPKKRNRRAKEKAREAKWATKEIQDWSLDDVLLWLQHLQLDDVASVLIGYEMRGEDLLKWDDEILNHLGVGNSESRAKILNELRELRIRGPQVKKPQRTLFDLVRSTCYDQVLAVETPLTPRDVTVCSGRMGCLQITKVNGVNLPLREGDCLLEINECPGEQFKSALMLTRLITASNGEPIRFVLLRRHSNQHSEDSSNETSSSGISSSPRLSTE